MPAILVLSSRSCFSFDFYYNGQADYVYGGGVLLFLLYRVHFFACVHLS